jgi:hypothetical protein
VNDPVQSIAEFIPRFRRGYNFHYAPLDAPPVLRRLTMNGSQTHEHIARQAQLVLKTNGVYFVQGEEDKGQLRWKFEYIVDDRRGKSGKILKGEKVHYPSKFSHVYSTPSIGANTTTFLLFSRASLVST